MTNAQILQIAKEITREAGAVLRQGFNQKKEITRKTSRVDLVTQYDNECEALISGRLTEHFPEHRQIGEEGTMTGGDSPFIWYVDPLDGTVNFAHGFPIDSVSMAL